MCRRYYKQSTAGCGVNEGHSYDVVSPSASQDHKTVLSPAQHIDAQFLGEHPTGMRLKGQINIVNGTVTKLSVGDGLADNCIEITTTESGSLTIRADSQSEADEWFEALRLAAKDYTASEPARGRRYTNNNNI